MGEKLSVIIPYKNEAHNIVGCLESVRAVADEILVADSGSTDGTLEIVRAQIDCRLIQNEWIDYSTFKNWAIPQATHDWVLIVDADERIPGELAGEIIETLISPAADLDGYWIGFRSYFMGHELRFASYNNSAFRLFRRDRCRYTDRRVHEEIDVDKDRAGKLKCRFQHYSFWSYDDYFQKYVKYTRMGADELWQRGKRASFRTLLVRPMLRFFMLYVVRLGFLDGLPGLQVCMLTAYFNTFVKQARLWEREHALSVSAVDQEDAENRAAKRRAA